MTQDEILAFKTKQLKALKAEQLKLLYCPHKDCAIRMSEPKSIANLEHTPTHTTIAVYEPIGWFKRVMLNQCFGLKYRTL